MRCWVDTDVGDDPDDAVALLCAAAHPDVEVVGVSVTGGRRAERARFARALVDAPVYDAGGAELVARFAAALPDGLLAIGPLTNVADLVAAGAVGTTEVVVMGGVLGAVHHRGAVRRVEHNFGADPVAAAAVVGGVAVTLTLVPLDVTVAMALEPGDVERLATAAPALRPAIEGWLAEQRGKSAPDVARLVLHDPLAFLVAARDVDADVAVQRERIAVDPHTGAVLRGRGVERDVVRGVDAPRAIARVRTLLGA